MYYFTYFSSRLRHFTLIVSFVLVAFLILPLGLLSTAYATNVAMTSTIPQGIVKKYFNHPQRIGSARFSVMAVDVYDATLFAPQGIWRPNQPFAIKIIYRLNAKGENLAKIAIKEMKKIQNIRQKDYEKWQQQMTKIFPDITSNSEIIAIKDLNNHVVFYVNDKKVGSIKNKLFCNIFFNIWLGENTSNPEIRNKLLGKTQSDLILNKY